MLNEKQKRFAEEYIIDLNATASAVRAGYAQKTAYSQGQRLLKNVEVQRYIQEIMAKKDEERIAKQDEVLEFLTSVLRGEIKEEFALGVGMGEQIVAKKEVDGKTRLKAAELLAKRYGLLVDKVEHSGAVGVQIVDDIGGDDE